jgi:Primase C terminal 2 (PriCT-2)
LLINPPREQPKSNAKQNNKAHGEKWPIEEEPNVREALLYIPADDRDKAWFRVGAALHDTGWPNVREIWDTWSKTSDKYNQKDQDKTWESYSRRYKPKPGKGPITLRDLFRMAHDNGWKNPGSPLADDNAHVLAEMNEVCAAVSVAGKFRVITFGPDKEFPKQVAVVAFSTKTDFLNHVIHPKVQVIEKNEAGATRPVKKSRGQFWISHPDRRQFDDIDFVPGGPPIIEVKTSRRVIRRHNMWAGFSVEPREGDCGLYLAHLFDHVCREDQAAYDYLLGSGGLIGEMTSRNRGAN